MVERDLDLFPARKSLLPDGAVDIAREERLLKRKEVASLARRDRSFAVRRQRSGHMLWGATESGRSMRDTEEKRCVIRLDAFFAHAVRSAEADAILKRSRSI